MGKTFGYILLRLHWGWIALVFLRKAFGKLNTRLNEVEHANWNAALRQMLQVLGSIVRIANVI